jgi:nucleotide-binding universal stress UspA family protein
MRTALAFVDFSDSTIAVVRTACAVAGPMGMKLIFMHVSTPDAESEGPRLRADVSREAVAAEMHRYRRELQFFANESNKLGIKSSWMLVRGRSNRGNPIPKMISELKRLKPDLIVLGTHQHGRLFEALFGSTSTRVIRSANCPILLVPPINRATRRLAKK